MVKFIDWLKQWAWIVFVLSIFIFGIYLVKGLSGLQATDWDPLTAEKWNELVSKVNWDIVCPTWFTKLESQWRVFGCIQTDRKWTDIFYNAIKDCYNTYGWRLPSYPEIYLAIQYYDLLNEWVYYEWTNQSDYWNTRAWWLISRNIEALMPTFGGLSTSYSYRCFIPAR